MTHTGFFFNYRYTFLSLFLSLLAGFAFPQEAEGLKKISALLEEYRSDNDLKQASYSFCILNAKTGKVLSEHNSNTALSPASTMKVLTTGAALGSLGTNFRYETKIQYTGTFDSVSGTISGDLVIKGSGDPTLNSQYFRKKEDTLQTADVWAKALKEKGVKKITGNIIGDASCFDEQIPANWIWGDMGNYFGAGACGLSYSDNKYSIFYSTGAAGEKAKVSSIVPAIPGLEIISEVKAGGSDDNAYIYGAPFQNNRKVLGTVPANQSKYEVEGSVPDPAAYCAAAFAEALKKAGIEVKGKSQSTYTPAEKGRTIYTHRSPSLEKIVYYTNLRSNNHYAETLLKTLALKKTGYGTTSAGCDAVLSFWKSRGVDTDGLFMNDGSGLSRSNGISTTQQATVLAKIYRDSTIYKSFNASLPVSGVSGSLANLCKGTFCEKNMRAKSGYITRARGYCGYVKTKKGEELSFSVLFNNYNCSPTEVKGKMERLLELLVDL